MVLELVTEKAYKGYAKLCQRHYRDSKTGVDMDDEEATSLPFVNCTSLGILEQRMTYTNVSCSYSAALLANHMGIYRLRKGKKKLQTPFTRKLNRFYNVFSSLFQIGNCYR